MDFYKNYSDYEEYLSGIWKKEEEFRSLLIERYEESVDKLKADFRRFAEKYTYEIIEKNNFMEARYRDNYIVIRIDFNEIYPVEKHELNLSIMKLQKPRKEYHIVIQPSSEIIYIPKRSTTINRPNPQNVDETKTYIGKIAEEIYALDEKLNELKEILFVFSCKDANYSPQKGEKLYIYDNLMSILESKLNN